MYKLCSIAVAIGLTATSMAWAGPLSAGKPAGVHQAQMSTGSIITAAGLGVIAVTVIAVAVSGDDAPAQNQGSTTTTTTTTTTS
jgi:hypothetical protein